MVCKYFIPFWTFSFHFVDYFFCCLGNFLVRYSPADLFLLCHLCLRCHYQKNHCQDIVKEMFPLCFLLWVLQFQVLYSAFNPFWVHFCRWCNLGVQFYFLHVVIQLSYTIHWRDYPFPIEYSWLLCLTFSSIQSFSRVWLSATPWTHTRPTCPSPTPGVYSNSCSLSQWCHPTTSSSVVPVSHLQSFPPSGSFQTSQFFTSGGHILEFQLQHHSFQWIFSTDFI